MMCQLSLNLEPSGPVQYCFSILTFLQQRGEERYILLCTIVLSSSNEREINSRNPNVIITLTTTNYLQKSVFRQTNPAHLLIFASNLMLILYIQYIPNDILHSSFCTKHLYEPPPAPVRATCSPNFSFVCFDHLHMNVKELHVSQLSQFQILSSPLISLTSRVSRTYKILVNRIVLCILVSMF